MRKDEGIFMSKKGQLGLETVSEFLLGKLSRKEASEEGKNFKAPLLEPAGAGRFCERDFGLPPGAASGAREIHDMLVSDHHAISGVTVLTVTERA